MKKLLPVYLFFITITAYTQTDLLREMPFDDKCLFSKRNIQNAERINYDDSKWRTLDLPHDWSIEDLPNPIPDNIIGPFDKGSVRGYQVGFTMGGTGWYRKRFINPQKSQDKLFTIYFDGVYMNSDVWLNGHHLGNHPHGYSAFHYDLTPYVKPAGQENVIEVKVRNEEKTSRWYSGSGIYRHVELTITDKLHIQPWGVYITMPEVSDSHATTKIKTSVQSKRNTENTLKLVTTIISPDKKKVGHVPSDVTIAVNSSKIEQQTITLNHPALWSIETPYLYKVT